MFLVSHIHYNKYSETFIRDHINYVDGVIGEIVGGACPTNIIYNKEYQNLHKKRIKFYKSLRSFLLWVDKYINGSKTGSNIQLFLLYVLLKLIKPQGVLAEYGEVGAYIARATKKANVKLVVHFHGYDIWRNDLVNTRKDDYKFMYEAASFFIVGSNAMYERAIHLGIEKSKLILAPVGIDIDRFPLISKPSKSGPVFISVGRFVMKKAPHLLVLSFAEVVKKVPGAKLYMIGKIEPNGELNEICNDLIISLGLQDNVFLEGTKNHNEIKDYFKKARGFIQHSVFAPNGDAEGTGVSVLEAAASGLPVVGTNHSGLSESIIDGKTGFLAEEKDITRYAQGIIKLAQDPELAETMGLEGRNYMKNNYNYMKYIEKINNALNGIYI